MSHELQAARIGDKCAWCPEIHGRPSTRTGKPIGLDPYKNGKVWILLCQHCNFDLMRRGLEAPVTPPPAKRVPKMDKRFVQEELL